MFIESGSGDKLSSSVKQYIQNLLKVKKKESLRVLLFLLIWDSVILYCMCSINMSVGDSMLVPLWNCLKCLKFTGQYGGGVWS